MNHLSEEDRCEALIRSIIPALYSEAEDTEAETGSPMSSPDTPLFHCNKVCVPCHCYICLLRVWTALIKLRRAQWTSGSPFSSRSSFSLDNADTGSSYSSFMSKLSGSALRVSHRTFCFVCVASKDKLASPTSRKMPRPSRRWPCFEELVAVTVQTSLGHVQTMLRANGSRYNLHWLLTLLAQAGRGVRKLKPICQYRWTTGCSSR